MAKPGSFWGQVVQGEPIPEELARKPRNIQECIARLNIEQNLKRRLILEHLLIAMLGESSQYDMMGCKGAPHGLVFIDKRTNKRLYIHAEPNSLDLAEKMLETENRTRHKEALEKLVAKYRKSLEPNTESADI